MKNPKFTTIMNRKMTYSPDLHYLSDPFKLFAGEAQPQTHR